MTLRERLRAGETILGLANTYPAAGIIEVMCTGWDLVWIDGQHGQMDYQAAANAVRAAENMGIHALIRVPTHEPLLLGIYADLDPEAIMVPMVDTVAQAQAVARGLCFPPVGNRSYGGRRVFDRHGADYHLAHTPVVVAQIESLEAVEQAAEIAAVDGIEMLFFGPDDMRLRMGLPTNVSAFEHPELRRAMQRTADAARAAGKWAGIAAGGSANARISRDLGYQLIMCGADAQFLRILSPQRLDEVKNAICEP